MIYSNDGVISLVKQIICYVTSASSKVKTITDMLLNNPIVIVISLYFSKAFDTVRHSILLEKMAKLDMPANVYNWLVDFSVDTLIAWCTKVKCL